jgi:hypothetical protein
MSDYLNNLVGRTLRLAPVVRPRLPSLFEPLPAEGGVSVEAFLPPHEDGKSASAAVAVAPPSMNADVASANPVTNSPNLMSGRIGGQPGNGSGVMDQPVPLTYANSAAQPVPTPVSTQTFGTNRPSIPDQTLKSGPTPHGPAGSPANVPRPIGPSVTTRADMRTESGPPGTPEERSLARPTPLNNESMRAVAASLGRERGRSRGRGPSPAAPAPDAPPKISVTIGRVDVRAVYPPAQAPRPRNVHPAPMSLDEYLKQQAEGRR